MSMPKLDQMLQAMWQDYLDLNPDARRIYKLFSAQNKNLINDHIALRTFDIPRVDIDTLAQPFLALGYVESGSYQFPIKQLVAKHYEHPDQQQPKIFISQLLVDQLPDTQQEIVHQLVSQIPDDVLQRDDFCYSGRHWPISFDSYQQLALVSEYAAWVYAMGFRPNHFTLLINALQSHSNLEQVNDFLLAQGFQLNSAGGLIKGSIDERLEQSSTLANPVDVQFSDQISSVPGCYYEFAQRYPDAKGKLFQGFVAASADKIFESTDRK